MFGRESRRCPKGHLGERQTIAEGSFKKETLRPVLLARQKKAAPSALDSHFCCGANGSMTALVALAKGSTPSSSCEPFPTIRNIDKHARPRTLRASSRPRGLRYASFPNCLQRERRPAVQAHRAYGDMI
jgi:hypothetical protein